VRHNQLKNWGELGGGGTSAVHSVPFFKLSVLKRLHKAHEIAGSKYKHEPE